MFLKIPVQASLEESFFHLHPSSLRRTVEFVADRTASNFIKQMRASFLPESLANCREEARNLAFSLSTKSNGNPKVWKIFFLLVVFMSRIQLFIQLTVFYHSFKLFGLHSMFKCDFFSQDGFP